MSLIDFASILGGNAMGLSSEDRATGFALDSREVHPGDLFLAIRGARSDGHDFVSAALAQGAAASLVERPVAGPHILVPNLVEALARMASHFRNEFKGPVLGITGSVGKTTTKAFVAAALSPLGKVAQTAGNRNTEYTAPLMWAEIGGDEAAVVVEMAMRGFGQIAHLASFSRPTIGLITNIGLSHLETVGSREGIARAKGELFEALPADGIAIANADDDYLELLKSMAPARFYTFGIDSGEARVKSCRTATWSESRVVFEVLGDTVEAVLPGAGRHLALNAASALLAARLAGVGLDQAAAALSRVELPAMRMEIRRLRGATVVLDAYNAAPSSFEAALLTLAELPIEGRRLVVMGEMKELGAESEAAHRRVGELMRETGVDQACFMGEAARFAMEAFARSDSVFATTLEDVRRWIETLRPGDTLLIKGSRALALERALESEEVTA